MRPVTDAPRHANDFTLEHPAAERATTPHIVTVHSKGTQDITLNFLKTALSGSVFRPHAIDATPFSATQLVNEIATHMQADGHLLLNIHGTKLDEQGNILDRHVLEVNETQPQLPTESLIRMVVDQLDLRYGRMPAGQRGLPFIHIFSCDAGELRTQISPDSDLWRRANLMIFAGTRSISLNSAGNSLAGAIAYIDYCQQRQRPANPLKLLYFAGLRRGDCITLMGGKLRAPLVWHAPKSGDDQNRIDNLSGAAKDRQRFTKMANALPPSFNRLLPSASLAEVMYNRITRDDAQRLGELLSQRPALANFRGPDGAYPLGIAASIRASGCLRQLLEHGASVDGRDTEGRTALCDAISPTYCPPVAADVAALLAFGADPNAQEPDGISALMVACHVGDAELVRMLLKANADPNLQDDEGNTGLGLSAEQGDVAVLQLLLAGGANPNLLNGQQLTPLILASELPACDAAGLLLENAADPNIQEKKEGFTALMKAAQHSRAATLQLLLQHGADTDRQNSAGATALMLAMQHADTRPTQLLLDAGADVNLQDAAGFTALRHAIELNNVAAIKLLLQHGARPDLPDRDGDNSLKAAARGMRLDALSTLLDADPGATDSLNQALVDQTRANGHISAAIMLQQALDARKTGATL